MLLVLLIALPWSWHSVQLWERLARLSPKFQLVWITDLVPHRGRTHTMCLYYCVFVLIRLLVVLSVALFVLHLLDHTLVSLF
jgi:hypothetical protein